MKGKLLAVLFVLAVLTVNPVFSNGQSDAEGETTVTMLTLEQAYPNGLKALASEFKAETGINLEIETMAQSTLLQKVGVELASKSSSYDMLFLEADRIPRFAGGGFIEPLDDYVSNPAYPDAKLDDFIKSTLDAYRYKGKLYALPYFAACQIMYYRGDILEEAGYGAPKNYDELLEISRKIHSDPVPAIAMRGQAGTHNMWVWSQFLYGMGGHFFKDYPNDLTPVVNSPQAVEALKVYVELMQDYSIPGAASAIYDDVVIAMQQGNVAIAIEGGPLGGRILDPSKSKVIGKVGFAVPPAGTEGAFPPFTAQANVINGASKNKEAAYKVLEWSTRAETMKRLALDSMHIAVTRDSVWEDQDFLDKYDFDYGYGSFVKAYQDTLAAGPSWYRPAFELWSECRDRVGLAVQEAVVRKASSEEALNKANEDITNLLKKNGFID